MEHRPRTVHQDIEEIAQNAQESLTTEEWAELCEAQAEWWSKQLADIDEG